MTEKKTKLAPLPGQVLAHSYDPDGPTLGVELGLTQTSSLYVGELSVETLTRNSIPEAVAKAHKGWWIAVIAGGKITPVAFTAPYSDGDEPNILVNAVSAAIRQARASAFLDGLPSGGRQSPIPEGGGV